MSLESEKDPVLKPCGRKLVPGQPHGIGDQFWFGIDANSWPTILQPLPLPYASQEPAKAGKLSLPTRLQGVPGSTALPAVSQRPRRVPRAATVHSTGLGTRDPALSLPGAFYVSDWAYRPCKHTNTSHSGLQGWNEISFHLLFFLKREKGGQRPRFFDW